jgi:dTDP-glucose 4,6-dehydratase
MTSHPLADDLDHILSHTRAVWEEFRGQRIFITGGTGVFGSWLLESFAWANQALGLGARALVLTRDADAFRKRMPHLARCDAIAFHPGDVRTFAFPEGAFSHVIHAATTSSAHPEQVGPEDMLETILDGTRHALEFARRAGARKFLFTSSGAVYGRHSREQSDISEADRTGPDPMDPASAYDEGKRIAELLCGLAYHEHGLETKVARCFAIIGPHVPLDMHFAIGNFLRDGLAGGPIRVGGDGTPYRSYLHTADLMVWLWTILASGHPGRAYNVGSDQALTIAELAQKVASLFSTDVQIARAVIPGQPAQRYVPSIQRARDELGLHVRIGLDDAVARTVAWHRQEVECTGAPSPLNPRED